MRHCIGRRTRGFPQLDEYSCESCRCSQPHLRAEEYDTAKHKGETRVHATRSSPTGAGKVAAWRTVGGATWRRVQSSAGLRTQLPGRWRTVWAQNNGFAKKRRRRAVEDGHKARQSDGGAGKPPGEDDLASSPLYRARKPPQTFAEEERFLALHRGAYQKRTASVRH